MIAVIKRDQRGVFRFSSLESDMGQSLLALHKLQADETDSVILLHNNSYSVKSDAVLDVFQILGGLYLPLATLKILPVSLRNRVYDWIARNRYKWFGRKDTCMIPTPELQKRFFSSK